MNAREAAHQSVLTATKVQIASLLQTHRQEILRLAAKHGIANVRVFGSVARGEAATSSDLDLLVDLEPDRSLIDRIAFMQELEDLLGVPVHVVTEKGLHPLIREAIGADAQKL
jgi:hypothetical protein